jgi:hypothetical protein
MYQPQPVYGGPPPQGYPPQGQYGMPPAGMGMTVNMGMPGGMPGMPMGGMSMQVTMSPPPPPMEVKTDRKTLDELLFRAQEVEVYFCRLMNQLGI